MIYVLLPRLKNKKQEVFKLSRYYNHKSTAQGLLGAAALHALPTRYRDWALNAGLMIEAGCVANNLRLGIGIKF